MLILLNFVWVFLLFDILFITEALYIKATDINIYCEKLYQTYVHELDW